MATGRLLQGPLPLWRMNCPGMSTYCWGLSKVLYVPVIGITGPPGAGKSTLVNSLIHVILQKSNKQVLGL